MKFIVGTKKVGRAARERASPKKSFIVGTKKVGRAARERASPKKSFIVGIDEVGRGALAGPVTVAVVLMPKKIKFGIHKALKLKDSKKLSAKQREIWFEYFKQHPKIEYAVSRVYPRQIEKINISKAANLAAERAYERLNSKFQILNSKVFLDGGLHLGNNGKSIRVNPRNDQRLSARTTAKTVVRGDEKIKAITAASIVAKVSRDKIMVRLAKKYPKYGFEIHKGYGTKAHMKAIGRHGPSSAHRFTFLS